MRQLREIFNAITPYHVRKRGLRIRVPCMLSLVDIHAQSVLTSAAYSHAFASLFLPTSNLFSWTSMYERANNYIFIYCSHISCPSSGVWVRLTQIGLHCNGPKCPCSTIGRTVSTQPMSASRQHLGKYKRQETHLDRIIVY